MNGTIKMNICALSQKHTRIARGVYDKRQKKRNETNDGATIIKAVHSYFWIRANSANSVQTSYQSAGLMSGKALQHFEI